MWADCRQLISPTLKGLPDLLNSHPRIAPKVRGTFGGWRYSEQSSHQSLSQSSDCLRLEMERTLFATVVMVRLRVWNTNCWDLLCKSYLLPLTVSQTVKANQPLRWDVDTNSEKRGWTFCPASSNTYPKSILLHNVKQPLKNNFKNVFEWLFLYDERKIKTYSPLNRDNFLLFLCLFSKHDTWLCWERNR